MVTRTQPRPGAMLSAYARLYATCLRESATAIRKSPWTVLLPVILMLGLQVVGMFLGGLPPLLAGIVLALATDAAISSYLYFLEQLVGKQRAAVKEFKRSFGAYFWSVLNLMFVLWIARFLLGMVLGGIPQGQAVYLGLLLVAAIALNAAPEVIYLRRTFGGLQTIQSSWDFLKANALPWFVPTLPLLAGIYVLTGALNRLAGGLGGLVISSVVSGALIHFYMVFRGFLFEDLDASSHRQRMFRQRMGM